MMVFPLQKSALVESIHVRWAVQRMMTEGFGRGNTGRMYMVLRGRNPRCFQFDQGEHLTGMALYS